MESLTDKTKQFLQKYLDKGQTVVCAVSGGADSMCLLHLVSKWRKNLKVKVIVAHVNYSLRGEDSNEDENLVRSVCKKLRVQCEVLKFPLKKSAKGNLEERAREIRHDFFKKVAERVGASYILIAHNEDDQLETILFRMFRGAGKRGESGMRAKDGIILRPLMNWPREGVRQYCKRQKIKFRCDRTNEDVKFSRNRLRLEIIPSLQELFPAFRSSFLANAALVREEDDFLDQLAMHTMDRVGELTGKRWSCRKEMWSGIHPAIQRRIIRVLHKGNYGTLERIRQKHIDEVMDLLRQAKTGKRKKIGQGTWSVTKNAVIFY